jgi:hypothetical protein
MRLRCEQGGTLEVDDYWWVDFWKVVRPLGLEVISYRCGPWTWYRGEDGEYIWTGGEWERRGEVRKWMDVPLHYPPFKGVASRHMRIARMSPDPLW